MQQQQEKLAKQVNKTKTFICVCNNDLLCAAKDKRLFLFLIRFRKDKE
jgi:hypothetical protein